MATITIPSPIGGTFTVEIKDSTNTTVYGPTSQGNAPFDPSISIDGDYVLYITYGGLTEGFCFTISECECPELQAVTVTFEDGSYYGNFKFNLPDGLLCAFNINVVTAFTSGTFLIDSLSDFTSNVGDVYTKKFIIGGVGDLSYTVTLLGGTSCYSGSITPDCDSPIFTVTGRRDGADCYIDIEFTECGTCTSVTANYTETSGDDIGSYTYSIPDCDSLPVTSSHLLAPTVLCGDVIYNVSITDCCGSITNYTLNFGEVECVGPIPTSISLRKTGSDYFLDIVFPDCGVDCHTFLVYGSQIGPFGSGFAGNIPFTNPTISCGEVFPFTYSLQVFPNITPISGLIRYNVTYQNCCCSVSHAVPEVAV